jgi:hypothetical protein
MRAKRDPEVEAELEKWIGAVLRCTLEPPGDLSESLKSGIYLCKYVHSLLLCLRLRLRLRLVLTDPLCGIGVG